MNRGVSHTTGAPNLTVRTRRQVRVTLDAICVCVFITPATRLRRLPIALLQHLDSVFFTLMKIVEIADIVVGAVTATSYKAVKLRTWWWVSGGENTTIESYD